MWKFDNMPPTQDHMRHHRACKGKAHASGIGRQQQQQQQVTKSSPAVPKIAHRQQPTSKLKNDAKKTTPTVVRKLSRNSTSSWDYSDSDSLNSSEPDPSAGVMHDSMIRRIDQVLDDLDNAKPLKPAGTLSRNSSIRRSKKENWADTLRTGPHVDDKIKRMEQGWDDSNVIKLPRERKCQRITAQERADIDTINRKNLLMLSRRTSSGKVVKRTRSTSSNAPLLEWEELMEMAMASRNGRKRRESDASSYFKDLDSLRNNNVVNNLIEVRGGVDKLL